MSNPHKTHFSITRSGVAENKSTKSLEGHRFVFRNHFITPSFLTTFSEWNWQVETSWNRPINETNSVAFPSLSKPETSINRFAGNCSPFDRSKARNFQLPYFSTHLFFSNSFGFSLSSTFSRRKNPNGKGVLVVWWWLWWWCKWDWGRGNFFHPTKSRIPQKSKSNGNPEIFDPNSFWWRQFPFGQAKKKGWRIWQGVSCPSLRRTIRHIFHLAKEPNFGFLILNICLYLFPGLFSLFMFSFLFFYLYFFVYCCTPNTPCSLLFY